MQTFWTRGYAATSTQDLVDALGINRSSLYSTFGSKDELYRRALHRYVGADEPWVHALLDAPGPIRARLRTALLLAVTDDLDPDRSRGCFVGNAAVERSPVDERVRKLVIGGFRSARDTFADALTRARDRGEVSSDVDVDALASLLLATFEGLRVVAKGSRDRRLVEQAVDAVAGMF